MDNAADDVDDELPTPSLAEAIKLISTFVRRECHPLGGQEGIAELYAAIEVVEDACKPQRGPKMSTFSSALQKCCKHLPDTIEGAEQICASCSLQVVSAFVQVELGTQGPTAIAMQRLQAAFNTKASLPRTEFKPWEQHFVLMAFHLLWDNWPSQGEHPHNDDIGELLQKVQQLMGMDS